MPSPDAVRAWQAAIQVAVRTRALFVHFPPRGYAELRDQMARSSESIGNNIAEGRGSAFQAEYARFLDTAARSANELHSQLTTALGYGIVPKREAFNLIGTVICTRRMVESLRDVVQSKLRADETRKRAGRARKRTAARNPKPNRKPEPEPEPEAEAGLSNGATNP